jgi:CRP-like cAMP-binding protein
MAKSINISGGIGSPNFDLSKIGRRVAVKAGEIFFLQGDCADELFYVELGRVKLTTTSDQGKEAIIAILGPRDFFGEGTLAGQTQRISTAVAMLPSSVLRIDKAAVLHLLHHEPAFSELVLTSLLARSVRMEENLIDHLFNSSEKRLARVLLQLANFGNDGLPEPISAKISQRDLAQMIGTTRSRVNFFMNKFRRLGFIDYEGHVHLKVHNSLLRVLLYDDFESRWEAGWERVSRERSPGRPV